MSLKEICEMFEQMLGCSGTLKEIIASAEESCGIQDCSGSLFDRADRICQAIEGKTAERALAEFKATSVSGSGGVSASASASTSAGGSGSGNASKRQNAAAASSLPKAAKQAKQAVPAKAIKPNAPVKQEASATAAKQNAPAQQKAPPPIAAEDAVILKLPSSVPDHNSVSLWEEKLMPRGDLSMHSGFYLIAQDLVRPHMQDKLASGPKKGMRLDEALKQVLKAPNLEGRLEEATFRESFMHLNGEPCVRGRPSWDNKAAKLAGLLLWFSLPQMDRRSRLELTTAGPFSKDYHLKLKQLDAVAPAAPSAAPFAAPTTTAPQHKPAACDATPSASAPEPATLGEQTPAAPAAPLNALGGSALGDSALGGSTQASHAAAAPQTPAVPVAPASPEAAPASTSTAAGKRPAADLIQIFVKEPAGRCLSYSVCYYETGAAVKLLIEQKTGLPAADFKLLFAGRELSDEKRLNETKVQKEATLHLMHRQGVDKRRTRGDDEPQATQPMDIEEQEEAKEQEEEDKEEEEEEMAAEGPVHEAMHPSQDRAALRLRTYDTHDGWLEVDGIDVRAAQQWLLRNQAGVSTDYGSQGNKLTYLLCRQHAYHEQVGDKIRRMLGATLAEKPASWDSVPRELLALDAQLRRVLVDDSSGLPLLGSEEDGEFLLGFAQPTLLPVVTRGECRSLTPHFDKPGYGCVIITVGLYGQVLVQLTNRAAGAVGHSEILPVERQVPIGVGMAYGMVGKARWKMDHDAVLERNEPPIPELCTVSGDRRVSVARAAVTLRYFRRSWAQLEARRAEPPPPPPPPLSQRVQPGDFVDVYSYDAHAQPSQVGKYPYSYPAFVLSVDERERVVWVCYVSDGLGVDDGLEAAELAQVPWHGATPSSVAVKQRCREIVASGRLVATLELLLAFLAEATSAAAASEAEGASTVPLELPWVSVPVLRRSETAALVRSTPRETYAQLCMALECISGEDDGKSRIAKLLQRTSRWDS